jgi:hypothetical protein
LEQYANTGYEPINKYLRTSQWDTNNSSEIKKEEFSEYVSNLDNLVSRTETPRDFTLFRAASDTNFTNLKVGDTFSDRGFVSTTVDSAQLKDFLPKNGSGVTLEINLPAQSKALSIQKYYKDAVYGEKPMSYILAENEYILPRLTNFQVTGIEEVNYGASPVRLVKVKAKTP